MQTTTIQSAHPRVAPLTRWAVKTAFLAAVAVVAGIGAILFAPTAIGGSTSLVVTEGTSMLPTFRAGGVVLTRTAHDYRVGDVVAYHSSDLDAVVMHRIVRRGGDGYVFKGDNNDYLDRSVATRDDLIGKEWIYVPGAGRVVIWLRTPLTFGVVVALMVLIALIVPERSARGARRRRRHGR